MPGTTFGCMKAPGGFHGTLLVQLRPMSMLVARFFFGSSAQMGSSGSCRRLRGLGFRV